MTQRSLFPKDGLPRGLRADFDAFWNAYPPRRPNPRALAEVAFAAAVRNGAAPEDLVRAADAHASGLAAAPALCEATVRVGWVDLQRMRPGRLPAQLLEQLQP